MQNSTHFYLPLICKAAETPDEIDARGKSVWILFGVWVPIIFLHEVIAADPDFDIDGLVHERRNSIANALELRLSCTNPLICKYSKQMYHQQSRPLMINHQVMFTCSGPEHALFHM